MLRTTHGCGILPGFLLGIAILPGCSKPVPPIPREPATAEIKRASAGANRFALDLYGQLGQQTEGNLFFSPDSIATALTMVYAGAQGETEQQMADVLHINLLQPQLHQAMGAKARDLDSAGKHRGYELYLANRLWVRNNVQLADPYLKLIRDHYGAEAGRLDFAGNSEASRHTINKWVAGKTQGMIPDLVQPGVIHPDIALVLANAIYFKGEWALPFEQGDTQDADFHISAGQTVRVPMMHQHEHFRYAATDDVQLLELPYRGDDISMLIALPQRADGLAELEARFNSPQLKAWTDKLYPREVYVWLPRFELTSRFNLSDALATLGMPLAFSDNADFSGFGHTNPIRLDAVVHQAVVKVNEQGTVAAAATAEPAADAAAEEGPPTFRADHPFLFLIRDDHTGSILFMGRVADPR